MTKEDYVWVGIRIFGIYLLVLALTTLPNLVHSGYMSYHMHHLTRMQDHLMEGTEESPDKLATLMHKFLETGFVAQAGNAMTCIVRIVLFSLAGLYMTCRGRFLFRIVSSPIRKIGDT